MTIRFRNYNIQDGLSSNEINSIYQDRRGFIWFGTSNGLSRFDGYEFMNFRSTYKIPDYFSSNTILKICEDHEGRLWLVTPNAINVFNPRDHSVWKLDDDRLNGQKINTLCVLRNGRVMIGAVPGLFVYDPEKDSLFQCSYPYQGDRSELKHIRAIYEDRSGNIWIGAWDRGCAVIRKGGDEIETLKHVDLPRYLTVNSFAEDEVGNLYLGTWGDGLICMEHPLDSEQMRVRTLVRNRSDVHHLDWNIIYDMTIDAQRRIWIGSPKGLRIVSWQGDQLVAQEYRSVSDLDNQTLHEVQAIFKDRDGAVWLSDFGNGVYISQPYHSEIQEIDLRKKGLNFSAVTAIHRDPENVLWLGVQGCGLVRYDLAQKRVLPEDPYLRRIDAESNAVMGFAEIPENGQLFMAMRYYGVYEVKTRDGQIVGIQHYDTKKLPARNIFTNAIARDQQNNIWVGTKCGLSLLRYDPTTQSHTIVEPEAVNVSLFNYVIGSIFVDRDNRLWVGSAESGLFRLRYDVQAETVSEFNRYCVDRGNINDNKIQTVFQDTKGRLWVGTYGGGLSVYDSQADCFRVIQNMQFFSSDVISSIAEDSLGNLWLATGNGITCYNPDSSQGNIKNYGVGSELRNLSFIKNAVAYNGEDLIFGGYDGLSIFNPTALLTEKTVTAPSIVDIQLFNESLNVLPSDKRDRITSAMPPYTERIVLTHRDYSVSLRFASPCYENSMLNKYAYKLEGIDKEWNYVTAAQRIVTYTSLKPGNYVFNVMASNDRGNWTTEPTRLYITVLPAPWMTTAAFVGYFLILCLLGYMAFRIVRNRIRLRRALEIEQMERLKSEEVNNTKLTFFTNVSHELFTPITVMSCSLEKLFESEQGDPSLHRIIRSNLNRLMRLLQQILEFRKADSANLKLKVSQTDIVVFVKRMCDENFAPLGSDKNVKLIFTSEEDHLDGYVDPDKLDKILYNLLSNAFKYNRQDGKVFVHVGQQHSAQGRSVVLSVRDTGLGIEPQHLPHLFKRFYEGDYRKFHTKGTGIGLSLTKDLVDLHRGTITVASRVNEGTTFTVQLPIDREAYAPEQIDSEILLPGEPASPLVLESPPSSGDSENRYSLLLVEDNEELLMVMQNILQPRYAIFTARNGVEALAVLGKENIDLVITDYVMPEMDGAELCRRIRMDISLSHLPVIMLSARSAVESKLTSFESGVDAYVSKPFEIKLLVAQVEGMIANRNRLAERFRKEPEIAVDGLINTGLDKQFIDRAVQLVEEHLSDPDFDINAFNQAMNMSNSTLYRKIKGITGMSPKEFIRNIRFKVACKLLLEKSSNISEVAFMVGFGDAKYFSLSFKKEFGITPRQYISQQNGKKRSE